MRSREDLEFAVDLGAEFLKEYFPLRFEAIQELIAKSSAEGCFDVGSCSECVLANLGEILYGKKDYIYCRERLILPMKRFLIEWGATDFCKEPNRLFQDSKVTSDLGFNGCFDEYATLTRLWREKYGAK